MKQTSFDLNLSSRTTRKQLFLAQMQRVVPRAAIVELIVPFHPEGKNSRPPIALETMLRVHFMKQWFSLSDPAMEEAFFETPLYREFVQLADHGRLPAESTILRFGRTQSPRHRMEKHKLADQILATVNDILGAQGLLLKVGAAVAATLIGKRSANPSSRGWLKLGISSHCNQPRGRDEDGSRTNAALPGCGGGVLGLWPEGQGVGPGQWRA